ncbi:DUF3455 domain-containing protein [Paraburkholderia rhizosphaerae]|uniref:Uncharacterized protein DUF3455 n=1 Tax=Paraburkholderia rhizosphaerae TaxID=480658 RepID=A0A4R8LWD0_9BURK|nr:DUF3455 domain-containing protein [Paraburkholderia rhizosphaerae]TDY51482.1 uncharacterized protein DUF3455 [Paraburkholderia rhizosphaerae]
MYRRQFTLASVLSLLTAACAGGSAPAQSAVPTASSLMPMNAQLFASTTATGVQVYSCEYDSSHHLSWLFKNPQATLYDTLGRPVYHHDAGPSWQADDGSRIVGHAVAQMASASTGSIPQLLLETTHSDKPGQLSSVRFVQRLNTVGGSAPATMCTAEHQIAYSPYFANYVFWK